MEDKEYKFAEIAGFEDYIIYENGQVFSKKSKKFLKPSLQTKGYLQVGLTKFGQSTTFFLHRLLAQHFIPNPEMKDQVDHIDGNKLNNSLTNLRWANKSENRRNRPKGKNNTSGEKNVAYFKDRKQWRVRFTMDGVRIDFGYFDSYDNAVTCARENRRKLHGDFAKDD